MQKCKMYEAKERINKMDTISLELLKHIFRIVNCVPPIFITSPILSTAEKQKSLHYYVLPCEDTYQSRVP